MNPLVSGAPNVQPVSRRNQAGGLQLSASWLGALQRRDIVDLAEHRALRAPGHLLRRQRPEHLRAARSPGPGGNGPGEQQLYLRSRWDGDGNAVVEPISEPHAY